MKIDSSQLVVAAKVYARSVGLPLDANEVYESLEEAQEYTKTKVAYAGQTIKVLQNGKYETYVLNPIEDALEGEAKFTLDKIGVDESQLKNYVQIVNSLTNAKEQGVIYINTTDQKGYIWNGQNHQIIFENIVNEEGQGLPEQLQDLKNQFNEYARLDGTTFTGTVILNADPKENLEAVTKQYVDKLITGLNSFTVGIVDESHPLPLIDYTVGQTFRVTEAGTYAGIKTEIGDLILVIQDYNAESASPEKDFMVIQANIDGAVIGPETATDSALAIYDGVTGKKIKNSDITLSDIQGVIKNSHTHANQEILDSYTQTQEKLLATVDTKITDEDNKIQNQLTEKIDRTELEQYYTSTIIDSKIEDINTSINTKITKEDLNDRLGAKIQEGTTVADYIDTAVGTGGTDSAEAIAHALQEAKEYTDTSLTMIDF